jgi:nucleoid-associated protein YgaU
MRGVRHPNPGRKAGALAQVRGLRGVELRDEEGGAVTDKTDTTPPSDQPWSAEQWHEVTRGESLWKIAERYYGDGSLYPKIFEANRDVLKDPNRIKVGQRLRIP